MQRFTWKALNQDNTDELLLWSCCSLSRGRKLRTLTKIQTSFSAFVLLAKYLVRWIVGNMLVIRFHLVENPPPTQLIISMYCPLIADILGGTLLLVIQDRCLFKEKNVMESIVNWYQWKLKQSKSTRKLKLVECRAIKFLFPTLLTLLPLSRKLQKGQQTSTDQHQLPELW